MTGDITWSRTPDDDDARDESSSRTVAKIANHRAELERSPGLDKLRRYL